MFELHRLSYRARISLLSLIVVALSLPVGINLSLQQTIIDSKAKNNYRYQQPLPVPTLVKQGAKTCVVAGCSGQLCVDSKSQDIATTCQWHASYACFHSATCELQASGDCGWTQTPQLQQCLLESQSKPPPDTMPYIPPDYTDDASL